MEIHSIDGYGTDAYIYLQVNEKDLEIFQVSSFDIS